MRSKPFWSRTGATTTTPVVVALPSDWSELKVWVDVASYVQVGRLYTAPNITSVNAITSLLSRGTPTGGGFYLTVNPNDSDVATTTLLTYDDSAADVKTALIATGFFATGDITAAGGALPTTITLTWTGVYAGTVPSISVVSSVTGGTNSSIISRTTTDPAGNNKYGYIEAGTQEVFSSSAHGRETSDRFLYVAGTGGAGNYRVSAYL